MNSHSGAVSSARTLLAAVLLATVAQAQEREWPSSC